MLWLLGGKEASLRKMYQAGISVPYSFLCDME